MTRSEKLAAKKLDIEIENIYIQNCVGIEIDMMDIAKIFEVARKAHIENRCMKTAIVEFVQSIRKN